MNASDWTAARSADDKDEIAMIAWIFTAASWMITSCVLFFYIQKLRSSIQHLMDVQRRLEIRSLDRAKISKQKIEKILRDRDSHTTKTPLTQAAAEFEAKELLEVSPSE